MSDEEKPGTPILRADAVEDEEHQELEAEGALDGKDTLAQQPDLLEEIHEAAPGLHCPVCGLTECFHQLPYVE